MKRDLELFLENETHQRSHFYNPFFFVRIFDQNGRYKFEKVKNIGRQSPGGNIFLLKHLFVLIHYNMNHWSVIVMSEKRYRTMTARVTTVLLILNCLFII